MSEVVKSKAVVTANATGVAVAGTNTLLMTVAAASDVSIAISGTFVGTITFEGTNDNVNWYTISLRPSDAVADGTRVTTATAPGFFLGDVAVYQAVRARCSAYTSGTAVLKGSKGYR